MAFPPVPKCSKSEIDRSGKKLTHAAVGTPEYAQSVEMVNAWRVCHAYPINTFNTTLRTKVKQYKDPIVAQRLKRLPTIIDKLQRYPEMKLSRMQDIGGVRAVVNSIKEVESLRRQYEDQTRFPHELIRVNDYITNPKIDGYRGVHLVFRYNNTLARNGLAAQYKGLLIELQIRTKLQHNWATAVETMGMLRGEALKSRKGSKEWLDFFALTSSAFAHLERTVPVNQHQGLDAIDTFKKLAEHEANLNALEKIKGLSVAADFINKRRPGSSYYLIVLSPEEHAAKIQSFPRSELITASKAYEDAESEAARGSKTEPVLVSVGQLNSLRKAYPNYFLDIREFVEKIEVIVTEIRRTEV